MATPTLSKPASTVYKFGTSGYRNDRDDGFNEAVVIQITCAIADTLIEKMNADGVARPVLVGGDTRPKTKMAIPIIIETLLSRGVDVYEIQGDVPTPVLAYAAAYLGTILGNDKGSAGAILMTASHNPWNYGGYNFLTPDGAVAPSSLSKQFEDYQAHPKNLVLDREKLGAEGEPKSIQIMPYESYLKHLITGIKIDTAALKAANLKVGYDPLFATGRYYFPKLMEDLGVTDMTVINNDDAPPEGYTGEPEPSAENLAVLSKIVKGFTDKDPNCLAVGFSNDGDADRFGVQDEQGRFVHPNMILQLIAYLLTEHRGITEGAIARSQSTTHALDDIAEKTGLSVLQTAVGYKFLAEAFIEHKEDPSLPTIVLGGESSGGMSIDGHIPEKDGLLANILVAELIAREKLPLSQIIEKVKAFAKHHYVFAEWAIVTELKSDILADAQELLDNGGSMGSAFVVDVPTSQASAKNLKAVFGTQDGVKLYLQDGGWVLLRASGTEPLVRLYLETVGDSDDAAQKNLNDLADYWLTHLDNLGISKASIKRKS